VHEIVDPVSAIARLFSGTSCTVFSVHPCFAQKGMMELVVIGAMAGVALGLRYQVWILFPAVTLAAIFTVMVGVGRADSFWSIVLMTVAVVTVFQLGYLAGIAIHTIIEEIVQSRDDNGDSGQSLGMLPFSIIGISGDHEVAAGQPFFR
jgi:hypothetical protein